MRLNLIIIFYEIMNFLRDNKEGKERYEFEGMGGGREGLGWGYGFFKFVFFKIY